MEQLLKIAFNELGTEEIVCTEHNPEVLNMLKTQKLKELPATKFRGAALL